MGSSRFGYSTQPNARAKSHCNHKYPSLHTHTYISAPHELRRIYCVCTYLQHMQELRYNTRPHNDNGVCHGTDGKNNNTKMEKLCARPLEQICHRTDRNKTITVFHLALARMLWAYAFTSIIQSHTTLLLLPHRLRWKDLHLDGHGIGIVAIGVGGESGEKHKTAKTT